MTLTLLATLACSEAPPPGGLPPLPPSRGVAWYTSLDGASWVRQPGYAHEGLQSLGLAVADGGDLWLTGLNMRGQAGLVERFVTGPPVHGARFGGAAWTATTWSVQDPEAPNFIDPQWFEGALWYVARPGTHGDPALDGGKNRLRSSPPPQDRLVRATATDPSPVRFGGKLFLFFTTEARRVELWSGEPLAFVRAWDRVTVPFAAEIAGELWLVAQRVGAVRRPVLARSRDGVTWSDFTAMLPEEATACTSPVVGPNPAGGLVLLCVEESVP